MNDQATNLKRTPLHGLHEELGAKLVPFAGYSMPVQYAGGIKHEHTHTREHAGLFDVSHMGQISIRGPLTALEDLVPGDIESLTVGQQRYTVLTNANGGIVDDLMVTRLPERLFAVVNAAYKETDYALLSACLDSACVIDLHEDRALLALQGPAASSVLTAVCEQAGALAFMMAAEGVIDGIDCLVNRSGYTGEDGFEISVAAGDADPLARVLLANAEVEPVGLGARDSLRLEAGLCLSGTDIDATTTPVEAGLSWLIAKKYRRSDPVPAKFPGAPIILQQIRDGVQRTRVGLRPQGRIPLRGGTAVMNDRGDEVGRISSGSFGPTVGHPVAMGYVDRELAAEGTVLEVSIRERAHAVEVSALPFVAHRYHRT